MRGDLERTKDGFESTIGVSYFGHVLLTELLLDTLRASAPSRMAIVSSVVHAGKPPEPSPARPQRPQTTSGATSTTCRPTAEAKVASVLYAMELAERMAGTGVSTFSVHPGWARSNFGSGGSLPMRIAMAVMRPLSRFVSDSNEESAQTTPPLPVVRRRPEPLGRLLQPKQHPLPGPGVSTRRLAHGDPEPERQEHGHRQTTDRTELRPRRPGAASPVRRLSGSTEGKGDTACSSNTGSERSGSQWSSAGRGTSLVGTSRMGSER